MNGNHVVLFNRDIKPGGLAEYGIYPEKYKMKDGLRAQFQQILALPELDYYGNITIGRSGDITLEEVRAMGFQAILVTVGAQGKKWLGIPGENFTGVYHAKDLVYHYNRLPPYSQQVFQIGQRVAIIGVGNVMLDIVHWLMNHTDASEIYALARRGPMEVKFDRKEIQPVIANLHLPSLDEEIQRVTPALLEVGQDPEEAKNMLLAALPKAEPVHRTFRFQFRFLASPTRILGDETGRVCSLELEDNVLVRNGDNISARGSGQKHILGVDTVIYAIGDNVDTQLGLPLYGNEFLKCPEPRFPVDGISYEVCDPSSGCSVEGLFLAGWSRLASQGLVGIARKDGTNGARAILQYLQQTLPSGGTASLEKLSRRLSQLDKPYVVKSDLLRLKEIEEAEAAQLGEHEFKFASNEEMIEALELKVR